MAAYKLNNWYDQYEKIPQRQTVRDFSARERRHWINNVTAGIYFSEISTRSMLPMNRKGGLYAIDPGRLRVRREQGQ